MLFIQSEDGGDDAILVITTEEIFAMNYLKKGMPNRNACLNIIYILINPPATHILGDMYH